MRRSFWRGLREAPTSCPVSSAARQLTAEVAGTAAVEEGRCWAAQGSSWPGSGSWHAPVQLQQLHGPSPAAASPGSSRRAPDTPSPAPAGSAEAAAPPGPASNLGPCPPLSSAAFRPQLASPGLG